MTKRTREYSDSDEEPLEKKQCVEFFFSKKRVRKEESSVSIKEQSFYLTKKDLKRSCI
jgi:hypothetical protein